MTTRITKQNFSCRAAVPDDVPFLLELRESTMSAKRLYEALGFAVTGSDDHEYFMKLAI